MEYTYFGRIGLWVSRLCLGTVNFERHTSEEDTLPVLSQALQAGINFFDTTNSYNDCDASITVGSLRSTLGLDRGTSADVALARDGIGKRIVQRLKQFISKHVDIKKAAAIAMAIWLLNGGIPAHAEQQPELNIYQEQTTEQSMSGEGEEQTLANIHDDWEILKPPHGDKDFTHSFNYLLIEEANARSIMHLVYLGKSDDENFFLGLRGFIWNGDEVVIDKTINSLVGRNGLIKENIVDITEVKHIPNPVEKFYDLTILSIKDIDMTDYAPVVTAPYPDQGTDLKMYSYIIPEGKFWDPKSYPLGKRSCKAGRINSIHGFGYNNCLVVDSITSPGSPVVDKQNRLVGLYLGDKLLGEDQVLTAFASLVPTKLGYLDMEGYAVDAKDKIATTWGEIKQR